MRALLAAGAENEIHKSHNHIKINNSFRRLLDDIILCGFWGLLSFCDHEPTVISITVVASVRDYFIYNNCGIFTTNPPPFHRSVGVEQLRANQIPIHKERKGGCKGGYKGGTKE